MVSNIKNLILNNDKYYYVCSAGMGDMTVVCALYEALKESHNSDVHLILKPECEFIAKMYKIQDYTVAKFNIEDLRKIARSVLTPQKGKLFVAHPSYFSNLKDFFKPIYFRKSKIPFLEWYKTFLGLNTDCPMSDIKEIPELSKDKQKEILKLGDYESIVVLSPEAVSMPMYSQKFWENIAGELKSQGLIVISNVKEKKNKIKGTHYIQLSMKDAVALAYKSHKVYSVRSGFCDLLYKMENRLNVYYSDRDSLFLYSLNAMFNTDTINEIVEYELPENFSFTNNRFLANLRQLKYYFIPRFILDLFNLPRDISRFIRRKFLRCK